MVGARLFTQSSSVRCQLVIARVAAVAEVWRFVRRLHSNTTVSIVSFVVVALPGCFSARPLRSYVPYLMGSWVV